jgi:endonuclease YncB( thermonuclease family)
MALIKCPECGREVSDRARICPNCGCPAAGRAAKTAEANIRRSILIAAAALVVAVGLPVVIFAATKNPENIMTPQEPKPADIKNQAPGLSDNPGKISELAAIVLRLEAEVAKLEARPTAFPAPAAEDATLEALVAADDVILEAALDAAAQDRGPTGKGRLKKMKKGGLEKTAPAAFEATVLQVADDDTLVVRTADYEDMKIRLYGLGAPERRPPGGVSAAAALKPLQGRTVTVQKMGTDHYNRMLALVRHDGRVINADLAAQGRAWYSGQYCREQPICGRIQAAEAEARAGKKGIWATDESAQPWAWRRGE